MNSWSNLHSDLLNEIARRLYSYDDYTRLRLVCKSWNLKVSKTPDHRNNPWLILPFNASEPDTHHHLIEKKIYHLRLPEMQKSLIRGSCCGWLINLTVSNGALQVLNPFTKDHFDLPPISTFPDVVAYQPGHEKEYIMRDIRDDTTYTIESGIHMHTTQVAKIILSSNPSHNKHDLMAVAIYGDYGRLAFSRFGDNKWTDIPVMMKTIHCEFQDVIFHQDKKIYAVDWSGQLYEFDTQIINSLPLGGLISIGKPPLKRIIPCNYNLKYLVGRPDGDLIMVVRYFVEIPTQDEFEGLRSYRSFNFDIYTLNKKELIWSRVYNLGIYSLMLGINSSIWMPPYTSPNNHIYYSDNFVERHWSEIVGGHDIGVLDLSNGITNQLFPRRDLVCPAPVWLLSIQDL
ncbi:F-box-like domain superfamily [Sesbania bispinosa]|nr:F-box-like domain superfamily [Sesbania bispinosa]